MNELEDRDIVTVDFSREALGLFVDMLNDARITRDGCVISVTVDEYRPGKATLIIQQSAVPA